MHAPPPNPVVDFVVKEMTTRGAVRTSADFELSLESTLRVVLLFVLRVVFTTSLLILICWRRGRIA